MATAFLAGTLAAGLTGALAAAALRTVGFAAATFLAIGFLAAGFLAAGFFAGVIMSLVSHHRQKVAVIQKVNFSPGFSKKDGCEPSRGRAFRRNSKPGIQSLDLQPRFWPEV